MKHVFLKILIVLLIACSGLPASGQEGPVFMAFYWLQGQVTPPAPLPPPSDFSGVDGKQVIFYKGDWPQSEYVLGTIGTAGLSGKNNLYIINIFDGNLEIDPDNPANQYYLAVVNDPTDNYGADPVAVDISGQGYEIIDLNLAYGKGPKLSGPLSIKRLGDNANDDIEVSWDTTKYSKPQLYLLIGDESGGFTNAIDDIAKPWIKVAENDALITGLTAAVGTLQYSAGKLIHKSQVRAGATAVYYKMLAEEADEETLKDAQAVGKFNVAVGPMNTNPEKFFISFPLKLSPSTLITVIGKQAEHNDAIVTFNMKKDVIEGSVFDGPTQTWKEVSPDIPLINNLELGYAYGYAASSSKTITVVGEVLSYNNLPRKVKGGWDQKENLPAYAEWIGPAYPFPLSNNQTGLEETSLGNVSLLEAGTVVHYDVNANIIGGFESGMAFHKEKDLWLDGNGLSAKLTLIPGKGYLLMEPKKKEINWKQKLPLTPGQ